MKMNALVKTESHALAMSETELIKVLQTSLYPGAAIESIKMVLGYCKASGLDPMQKPVHIVPMWDSKTKQMRDVIMPGVGLYRTQASRTNRFAGQSEPEFGPMVSETLSGQRISYPEWAKVTVKKLMDNGTIAEFTAKEFWIENYAVKGGQEKSQAPNAMWSKRPRGQIGKCAAAQALRLAFPEMGSQPTAEEMEGKAMHADDFTPPNAVQEVSTELEASARKAASQGKASFAKFFNELDKAIRPQLRSIRAELDQMATEADAARTVETKAPRTFDSVMTALCGALNEDDLNAVSIHIEGFTEPEQEILNSKYDERLATMRGTE